MFARIHILNLTTLHIAYHKYNRLLNFSKEYARLKKNSRRVKEEIKNVIALYNELASDLEKAPIDVNNFAQDLLSTCTSSEGA